MSDSISVRQGSQIIPVVPNVVRSHPNLAARGLLVEHHVVEPAELPERELLQHNFFMYTCPTVRAEIKSPDFNGMQWIRPGVLWVMPQGCRHQVHFQGPTEGVALAFDPVRFDNLVEAAGGKCASQIVQSLAASPPKIEHLMRALDHESKLPIQYGSDIASSVLSLGLALKEWHGTNCRTKLLVAGGVLLLVGSAVVVGYGNHLKANETASITTRTQLGSARDITPR